MGVTTIPRDANGNYSLPVGYLAVTGQTILASQHNPPLEDLASAITNSLPRNGSAPMVAPLNMAGFRVTNIGDPSSDSDAATKAYIDDAIEAMTTRLLPTGSVFGFRLISPPTGWVKENGGTIGNALSGGTTRAHSDTEDLFTAMWTNFNNTKLPIQTSGGAASTRGASAAADFAANKRMPLFDSRSRFQRGADDSLGFDAALTVGLSQDDAIKNHKHPGTTANDTHNHGVPRGGTGGGSGGVQSSPDPTGGNVNTDDDTHNHAFTTDDNTGGSALETRGRSTVVLMCIKL